MPSFYKADLRGADLAGRNLRGKDYKQADLSGADLSGADLTGANFSYANLTGANLTGANLTGANLAGADVANACFLDATVTADELRGARNKPRATLPAGWQRTRLQVEAEPTSAPPSADAYPEPDNHIKGSWGNWP